MNPHIARLKTPEECDIVADNNATRDVGLSSEARRRAVELRAEQHGAKTNVEKDALQAVYAYETALFMQRGKKVRASRTWQMIDRHGIVPAVARVVDRPIESPAVKVLFDLKMLDLLFEAVVVRHPTSFEPQVVSRCRERLTEIGV